MNAHVAESAQGRADFGVFGAVRVCKEILNAVRERATIAAERSRFAALPVAVLEDAGMTVGDRAQALGYDEPALDPWRVVASHL